jgi:hypothetical protein
MVYGRSGIVSYITKTYFSRAVLGTEELTYPFLLRFSES